jgi:hypothetical protein
MNLIQKTRISNAKVQMSNQVQEISEKVIK